MGVGDIEEKVELEGEAVRRSLHSHCWFDFDAHRGVFSLDLRRVVLRNSGKRASLLTWTITNDLEDERWSKIEEIFCANTDGFHGGQMRFSSKKTEWVPMEMKNEKQKQQEKKKKGN